MKAFTPELKRCVVKATQDDAGGSDLVIVAKGLLTKMLRNGGERGADALSTFEVNDADRLQGAVDCVDARFAERHFKTIGVSFARMDESGEWNWRFAGILPMKDPPRHE